MRVHLSTKLKAVASFLDKRYGALYGFRAYADWVAERAFNMIKNSTPRRSGKTADSYSLVVEDTHSGRRYSICNENKQVIEWLSNGTPAHGPVTASFMQWVEKHHPLYKGFWRKAWVRGIKPHPFVLDTIEFVMQAMMMVGEDVRVISYV